MELKNILTPWNWFKNEQERDGSLPVKVGGYADEHPVIRLHRELDSLVNRFFGIPSGFFGGTFASPMKLLTPRVDISESKRQYVITIEAPGVEQKDMELSLAEGTLTLRGEKKSEHVQADESVHCVERSYGYFQRAISLPPDADESGVEARFTNGVLKITVPKRPGAKPAGKQIAIQ